VVVAPPPPPPPAPEPKPEVKPPEPEPVPAPVVSAPEPTPEPKAKPRPKAKGPGVRQQLTEARKLRESGSPERALDVYGKMAAQDPENAEALAGRGLCYFDLEQYAPAEASLQEALRLSPSQPDALLGLADTYRALGRKAEAIAMFERYLAAHPGGDEAALARNAINQLKEGP
jgi:tetratricopeptide (TPR) repeat protein